MGVFVGFLVIMALLGGLVYVVVVIERDQAKNRHSSVASTYHIPLERLSDPRWAIVNTTLVYVFRGRERKDKARIPMTAIHWLGDNDEQVMEAAERIVRWANQHQLDTLPDVAGLVRRMNMRDHGPNRHARYATPDDVLRYLEEWRVGTNQAREVREVD